MNPIKIKESLSMLDIEIRTYIHQVGIKKVVDLTGLKQPDISAWMNGRRKWSYEKLLNVAEKLI